MSATKPQHEGDSTAHPAYLRLQRILETVPPRHRYHDSKPEAALLKSTIVYLIKSPEGACRATTIKTVSKVAGFPASDVRHVLDFFIKENIVHQIARSDSSVLLMLTGGDSPDVY